MNFIEQLKQYYKNGTSGVKIIYCCVIASLAFWLLRRLPWGDFENIFLLSGSHFIPYVWTLFIFPLFHQDLFSLVFSMIMLYFTEQIFLTYFNQNSFIKFFAMGSVFGGIIFLAVGYLTHSDGYLGGAILGVYSVLFAVISYNSKMEVSLFPLPVRFPIYILGIILLALDFWGLKDYNTSFFLTNFLARLGAAAFGFLYMRQFEKGNDFLGKFIFDFFKVKDKKYKPKFETKPNENYQKEDSYEQVKPDESYQKDDSYEQAERPKTDEEFNAEKNENQKKIDAILDKISQYGYDKLTQEEKDFLFKQK